MLFRSDLFCWSLPTVLCCLPSFVKAPLWREILLDIGSLLLDVLLHCSDELEVSEKGVHPPLPCPCFYCRRRRSVFVLKIDVDVVFVVCALDTAYRVQSAPAAIPTAEGAQLSTSTRGTSSPRLLHCTSPDFSSCRCPTSAHVDALLCDPPKQ